MRIANKCGNGREKKTRRNFSSWMMVMTRWKTKQELMMRKPTIELYLPLPSLMFYFLELRHTYLPKYFV